MLEITPTQRSEMAETIITAIQSTIDECHKLTDHKLGYIALLETAAQLFILAGSMIKKEDAEAQKSIIINLLAAVSEEIVKMECDGEQLAAKYASDYYNQEDQKDPFTAFKPTVIH